MLKNIDVFRTSPNTTLTVITTHAHFWKISKKRQNFGDSQICFHFAKFSDNLKRKMQKHSRVCYHSTLHMLRLVHFDLHIFSKSMSLKIDGPLPHKIFPLWTKIFHTSARFYGRRRWRRLLPLPPHPHLKNFEKAPKFRQLKNSFSFHKIVKMSLRSLLFDCTFGLVRFDA